MIKQWLVRLSTVVVMGALVTGCASTNNPDDPLEGYNRAMFKVNDTVDQSVVQPVARAYNASLPQFVRTGVSNFFGNLGDLWSAVNQWAQGRGEVGFNSFGRFLMNSTLGLGGVVDWATALQVPKESSNLGQTIGRWGVASGPYLVLPILGPSTVRDAVTLPGDIYMNPWYQVKPMHTRNIGTVVGVVSLRAKLLEASDFLDDSGMDKYSFIRDAYMKQRELQIDRAKGIKPADDDGEWK